MTPEELVERKAAKDRALEITKHAVLLTAQGDCHAARDVIQDAVVDPAVFTEVIHHLVHGVATVSQELVAAEMTIKVLQGADNE